MRLDLRIITILNKYQFDLVAGEATKLPAITFTKYCDDKLKPFKS